MRHKIGIYMRVSTDEQVQVVEGSMDSQRHRLMSFVEIKNHQEPNWGRVIEVYSDEGLSAKDTRRPAFQKMMTDIRSGKINLILVTDLSRLSRNILDFCLLLEDLKKVNAKFLSMKEQFDTSTPAGEMMVFNMINLAQFERKQTSERVAVNFHSRALRGLSNGGPVPLGYEKDPANPSTYQVNELEAANVREIFRIFLEERTCKKVAARLYELGIKPKVRAQQTRLISKGKWSPATLLILLKNKSYVGIREINTKNKGKNPDSLKPAEMYKVVKATWPAIISQEDFDEAQEILSKSEMFQRNRLSGAKSRIFICTGLFKCADCGAPISGAASHSKKQPHRYYVHRKLVGEEVKCRVKRFRADEAEDAIVRHLGLVLDREGYLDGLEKNFEKKFNSKRADTKRRLLDLERRLVALENEVTQAFSLFNAMGASHGVELVREKLSQLAQAKLDLRGQIEDCQVQLDAAPDSSMARQAVQKNIEIFSRAWRKATPFQQKSLMHMVFESLVVEPERIAAHYRKPSDGHTSGTSIEGKGHGSFTSTEANRLFEFRRNVGKVPLDSRTSSKRYGSASVEENGARGGT